MDPRVFVLICLAAASRHQPSASLEVAVDRNDPQNYSYNETDFQRLRDAVHSGDFPGLGSAPLQQGAPGTDIKIAVYHGSWPKKEHAAEFGDWRPFLRSDPEEGWRLFKKLATFDFVPKEWNELDRLHLSLEMEACRRKVRKGSAKSPAWPILLETHNAEAWQLFKGLATDEAKDVRYGAGVSPAWPMLFKTHNAEAWQLVKDLAKDKDASVRFAASISPAWSDLVKSNPWEAWQLFAELVTDVDLQDPNLALSPAWKAFGSVPLTEVRQHLYGFTPTKLQDTAASLQKMADSGFTHQVKDLPLVTFFANRLHRSTNETSLGEMAKLEIFASKAALRLLELATKAKKEAEQERALAQAATAKMMILLVIVLLLAALCIVLFLLWFFYPTLRQWQDEKKLAAEAKQAIRAAEVFDMVISVTPEPPAHMAIFDNYQRIYGNPYVLYKYGYLKEALTQAFRISAEALDVGLHEWDFTAVQKNSRNAVQEMASDSYGMARTFIDKNQAADLDVLMQLCDQIQNDCSPYASKIEEADMTAVDKCFSMYEQAFVAKRAYFDPLLQRIGGKTGAETNLCGEKGILRLAEKNCLRPSGGLIWDCVRAMCVGHTVSELTEVMKCLKDEHDAKRLRIVHVNNRFKRPTSDNWQDIAVYVMFTDPRFNDVVAEIQLTHETFVAVRTKFKAHDAYDHIRFAAEALKLRDKVIVRGVPDSVTRDDQKKDSTT